MQRLLFLLTLFASMNAGAQTSLDAEIAKFKSNELGQIVLLLMPDKQQKAILWDHRSSSAIQWIDNGYVMQRRQNEEIAIRRGLVRVNVLGKPSSVLRQRRQELWWTVQFETAENPRFGVQRIEILPGTPRETCFGTLYDGCEFELLPSLKAAGITWREVCRADAGGERRRGYILQHPQRAFIQAQVMDSGGSGGNSTSVMLRPNGEYKELCAF